MKKCTSFLLTLLLFLTSFFPFLQTPLTTQKAYAEENCIYYVYEVGNKVRSTEYDPFGNWRAANGQANIHMLYQGQQLDSESSLYYLRARYYDPLIGRFISRDPVKGVLTNPQTQNPYAYALNNPINLSDPSGEFPIGQIAQQCALVATKLWPSASQAPQVIKGILYGEHVLGRMQPVGLGGRGIPPSVVQNAIDYGTKTAGNVAGRIVHTFENVVVVTDDAIKEVITTYTTGH